MHGKDHETFERRCESDTPINLATRGWSCCRQQEFCDCSVRLVLGQFSSLCLRGAMYDAVTVFPIPVSGEQTFRLYFNARIEDRNKTASMSSCGNRLEYRAVGSSWNNGFFWLYSTQTWRMCLKPISFVGCSTWLLGITLQNQFPSFLREEIFQAGMTSVTPFEERSLQWTSRGTGCL